MQFQSRLLRFLVQQLLVLFNNFTPEIRLPHLPAHHFLKVGIKLLCLPEKHHIVYGLCGKIVFDSFAFVFFSLKLCFFMAGFKFSLTLEEV